MAKRRVRSSRTNPAYKQTRLPYLRSSEPLASSPAGPHQKSTRSQAAKASLTLTVEDDYEEVLETPENLSGVEVVIFTPKKGSNSRGIPNIQHLPTPVASSQALNGAHPSAPVVLQSSESDVKITSNPTHISQTFKLHAPHKAHPSRTRRSPRFTKNGTDGAEDSDSEMLSPKLVQKPSRRITSDGFIGSESENKPSDVEFHPHREGRQSKSKTPQSPPPTGKNRAQKGNKAYVYPRSLIMGGSSGAAPISPSQRRILSSAEKSKKTALGKRNRLTSDTAKKESVIINDEDLDFSDKPAKRTRTYASPEGKSNELPTRVRKMARDRSSKPLKSGCHVNMEVDRDSDHIQGEQEVEIPRNEEEPVDLMEFERGMDDAAEQFDEHQTDEMEVDHVEAEEKAGKFEAGERYGSEREDDELMEIDGAEKPEVEVFEIEDAEVATGKDDSGDEGFTEEPANGDVNNNEDAGEDGDDEEIDDEPVVVKPRRRLRRGLAPYPEPMSPPSAQRKQELEDLEFDREDLKLSALKSTRTRARGLTPKKSRQLKQLDMLRRRRKGEKVPQLSNDSDDYSGDPGDEASEGEDDGQPTEIERVRQSIRRGITNDYDEDFVVPDDPEDTIGAPSGLGRVEIPLEFTHQAHKKPKEHFKDAVEWHVNNQIHPAFPRDHPIYQAAFRRLGDTVRYLASSKFKSSAWTQNFIRGLERRPYISANEIGRNEELIESKCEACNRSNHKPTFRIQFSGKMYDKETLEDLSSESDDSDKNGEEEEDDEEGGDEGIDRRKRRLSYDSKGNLVPGAETIFKVGRFCKSNAETAHNLIHWRYALNQWVIEWLEVNNKMTPEAIIRRQRWSKSRLSNYVDKIVEEMEKMGEIKRVFYDFRENLKQAEDSKPSQYHQR
ncbi:MAG: hypothetical protein M1829_004543 [Trizodia sp. TS-e1964]|nr:MAG: hypothetical protein M1829_004543 [Trizodia sp. TS-e1964]